MKSELPVRIVLKQPPAGVLYGIQRGKGPGYAVDQAQLSKGGDLVFDVSITVADNRKDGSPNFLGDYVQGPPSKRFVYIDVGTYAGQQDAAFARRIIALLGEISWPQIRKAQSAPGHKLCASIQGTDKKGEPSCATVPIIGGWSVI